MHIAEHRWFIRLVTLLLFQTVTVSQAATLEGFARLAADSFTPGPSSGQFIEPINDRHPPFENKQPLQGFSAIIEGDHGAYIVLSDNGFGRRDNSSDYILSIYHIDVDFRSVDGGSGNISVSSIVQLSDPDHLLPYPATRENDRLLTGADLDPESFRRDTDGSFWIGEEFNPSLVHFSAQGKLLAAPYKLEGLSSVDNPMGEPSTLPRSRGFEGMALSPDGKSLYPLLEGPLDDSGPGLNIYTFDLEKRQFTNSHAKQPSSRYRLDKDTTAIGDFTMFSQTSGLVIERDSGEGKKALSKKKSTGLILKTWMRTGLCAKPWSPICWILKTRMTLTRMV